MTSLYVTCDIIAEHLEIRDGVVTQLQYCAAEQGVHTRVQTTFREHWCSVKKFFLKMLIAIGE